MEGKRRAWTPTEDRRIRETARAVQRAGRGRGPGFAESRDSQCGGIGGKGARVKGRNLSVLANIRRYDGRATRETAAPTKQCGCGARAEHWRLLRDGTLRAFLCVVLAHCECGDVVTEAQVAAAVKLCDQLTAELARLTGGRDLCWFEQ